MDETIGNCSIEIQDMIKRENLNIELIGIVYDMNSSAKIASFIIGREFISVDFYNLKCLKDCVIDLALGKRVKKPCDVARWGIIDWKYV